MNISRLLPWRYVVRRFAQARGFIDPVMLYARLQRFSQPSEVAEPVELLRAGAVFHARGLINSKVLQHNLDWVWPYWVSRQYDPKDVSFMPRAFSITHVNLTHRNWTGIGLPGRSEIPIVDPRGMVTAFWDGWSIDVWCVDKDGKLLIPSRAENSYQWQNLEDELSVHTETKHLGMRLDCESSVVETEAGDVCRTKISATIPSGGWVVVSARPCNPEGVSFIDKIVLSKDRKQWLINNEHVVKFDSEVNQHHASNYANADVFVHLMDRSEELEQQCSAGLATSAALFTVDAQEIKQLTVNIPLERSAKTTLHRLREQPSESIDHAETSSSDPMENAPVKKEVTHDSEWRAALNGAAELNLPNEKFNRLYQAALGTLVLCSPDDVYAGPFTYKRYWYRDTVFIAHGLMCAGLLDRARHIVDHLPDRQDRSGYFHSQEGEWDSNGEVLWLIDRFRRFSNLPIADSLYSSVIAGANWINKKRLKENTGDAHEGLLPAGFSAEHLGTNDHYYWDNYWSIAGLDGARHIAQFKNDPSVEQKFKAYRTSLAEAVKRSLDRRSNRFRSKAIPAAPTRRLDAGAIGSVIASYPLQLVPPNDAGMSGTLEYLLKECFHDDAFFQDMIHSGMNAYLTLQVAQTLLRDGDNRFVDLIRAIADAASPTGHWPEAIHPHTEGGCMGDGHHAWAAAEWIAMMRYCFVREESASLILGSGFLPEWLETGRPLKFGPAPTLFGTITITVPKFDPQSNELIFDWAAKWHNSAPELEIAIPGFKKVLVVNANSHGSVSCERVVA